MNSSLRYHSVFKMTTLQKHHSEQTASNKKIQVRQSSCKKFQEYSQNSQELSTNPSSSQTQNFCKELIKSRSSQDIFGLSENNQEISAETLRKDAKLLQNKKSIKRTKSRDNFFSEWVEKYREQKKHNKESFINQKMNELQNLNNELNLLQKELKSNAQNLTHEKRKNFVQKLYYIGDLLQDLENLDREKDLLFLNHFKKNFQLFEKINRFNGLQSKSNSYHQTIRSQQKNKKGFPTLIMDLDETLILIEPSEKTFLRNPIYLPCPHTRKTKKFELKMRPFQNKFQEEASKIFEIIFFTTNSYEFKKQILTYVDPKKKLISKILSQDYTFCVRGEHQAYLKDLRKVSCDLRRTLYLSTNINCYALQPKNGIPIVPFSGNGEDNELVKLLEYLKKIEGMENMAFKNDENFMQSKYNYFFNKNMPTSLIAKSLYE